jgi:hypothetical protein
LQSKIYGCVVNATTNRNEQIPKRTYRLLWRFVRTMALLLFQVRLSIESPQSPSQVYFTYYKSTIHHPAISLVSRKRGSAHQHPHIKEFSLQCIPDEADTWLSPSACSPARHSPPSPRLPTRRSPAWHSPTRSPTSSQWPSSSG